MKRLLNILLVAMGSCLGCSKSDVLTPKEFTREYVEAVRRANPGVNIVIVKDLELKVTSAEGGKVSSFLDNAYDMYQQDPKAKTEVIHKFVTASLETLGHLKDEVDRTRIVPVIKDRPWLEETRQALLDRGATKTPEHVYEDFNPDLIVLFAEDSPKNIRYLVPKDLEHVKIERAELRTLACENLKRLLPEIKRHGTNGLYMLTAGGDYEASLLLLDSVWSGLQTEVQGDIVVAVPTRDLLLVTGTKDPQGIGKMKEMVKKISAEGAYRLTQKLFVYREGKFNEFREIADPEPRRPE